MDGIRTLIGKNLGIVMKLKGIQQKALAQHLGVAPSAVSNWLKGTNSIDIDNLAEACRFLDVSLDQIFGFARMPLFDITEEEATIMILFRNADEPSRQIATEILEAHQIKKEVSDAG